MDKIVDLTAIRMNKKELKGQQFLAIQNGKAQMDELIYNIRVAEQCLEVCSPELQEELTTKICNLNEQLNMVVARIKRDMRKIQNNNETVKNSPEETAMFQRLLEFFM